MAHPFVIATSCTEPDREFPTLRALATGLSAMRDTQGGHSLRAVSAILARSDLPGGRVVAVRLDDGALAGKGTLLAYAFLPRREDGREASALMDALAHLPAKAAA